ncbi:MAG: U32 family peptidase [Deltaproteobacteria bacterium]|nr:U32 family peptidase [Deltaproteobacteria bacterium]
MSKNKKVELLAPAGNPEKLEIAIHYGADAIYLAGKEFSLRNFSGNFTSDELQNAVKFAHEKDVKVYVACNIYSRNFEQKGVTDYLKYISKIGADAVIISDPGIFMEARSIIPEVSVHLSTQANTTNYKSVLFWEKLGVQRINVARELSLKEINEIALQSALKVEAFVHGAMCISYSGRCLLSSFMSNRESNRGMCTHPCRWKYAVVEELRPDKYYPLTEDNRGSYIFNSSDLCMIEHIREMIESGIDSLKIEGRMKSINYLASTVKVYREAIDSYYASPEDYETKTRWIEELASINNRGYCTGFYFGDPDQILPNYSKNTTSGAHLFIGKVIEKAGRCLASIEVRNKIFKGDDVEVLGRKGPVVKDKIIDIFNADGLSLPFAQPGSRVTALLNNECFPNDLIRRISNANA